MRIWKKLTLLPWKWKLAVWLAASIFFTFSIFTFFEYHTVSTWLLKQEETAVKQTMKEVLQSLEGNSNSITEENIQASLPFIKKINTDNQLIRISDQKGKVIVSHLNGDFPVLEPNELLENKEISYLTVGNHQSLVYSQTFKSSGFSGKVEIIRQLDSYHQLMKHLAFAMILFAVMTILISVAIGYILSWQALKPIKMLANTMNKIKSAGFKERMPVYNNKDEIAELSTIFNEMMDVIEQSFQQQKQFVEDASHELRTPISILEGHLSLLNRWGKRNPDILEESLQASVEETAKLKKLVLSLLNLTKLDQYRNGNPVSPEKVNEIIQHTIRDFHMLHKEFHFEQNIQSTKLYGITEEHFQQILNILIDNAIKYSSIKKEISIATAHTAGQFILQIEDKGIGIPKEDLQNVFYRFYRVDKARTREQGGTGLGLSIAKKLVDLYKGEISIKSKEGIGTKVMVKFPV
ncbi:HAMP domain-containing sensor histidine kinase [Niallia nealsonii]|uniref:Signal transduction histidine-protein kinase ArlS n=1 Tax=Niallia nealsonii TaxID=115979 RepID=A0A2N0YYU7_9BACI|nr:HAMP domain-containing histidine kinase [Niallia nealsonii]PKG22431.1 two-component sensor histidine kinase [Niallia nealsonii]